MSRRNDRPFDHIHPDLVDLLLRQDVFPHDDVDALPEEVLADAISLAIALAEPGEQAQIVSRIMTNDEVALEGLQHPDVGNLSLRIALTAGERAAILRASPAVEHGEEQELAAWGNCLICTEDAHLTVPCGCLYCLPCLREAICVGLRSEEAFPPRCCAPFPEATIRLGRRPALVHLYRNMQVEMATPIQHRLYCHDGRCAAFIPPSSHRDRAQAGPGLEMECPACGRLTCQGCGRRGHDGEHMCGEEVGTTGDDAAEDVWATMDRNGVVNCPGCGRMVSLLDGCNHITCVCGTQFCYICGALWRTCECPGYRGYHLMVPIKDRAGLKPEQWRRHRREELARPPAAAEEARTIPQLRPRPDQRPLSWDVPRRRMSDPPGDTARGRGSRVQQLATGPIEEPWGDVRDATLHIERQMSWPRAGVHVGLGGAEFQGDDEPEHIENTGANVGRQPSPANNTQREQYPDEQTTGGGVQRMTEADEELHLARQIRHSTRTLERRGWAAGRPARMAFLTALAGFLEVIMEHDRGEDRRRRRGTRTRRRD